MATKKILFIGFPNAGKTCITKAFFYGADPEQLLSDLGAPEPTLGVQQYTSAWIDTDIGIVDSSGQELQRFLTGDEFDQDMAIGSSDAIIYVFDINHWKEQQEEVLENLVKIRELRNKIAKDARIFAFCHKIDLIMDDKKNRVEIFEGVKKEIQQNMAIKTIFSSISPKLIHTLFRSLQIILNDLTKKGKSLEDFLKDILLSKQSSAMVLLDKNYKVISERRSEDISLVSMYGFVNIIKILDKSFKKIDHKDYFLDGSMKSFNGMQVYVKGIQENQYNIAFLLIFSKNISLKTVDKIVDFIGHK